VEEKSRVGDPAKTSVYTKEKKIYVNMCVE
jgi:hypothetical protein